MPIEIRVPTLGESVSEATVAKWLKKVGDVVRMDEPLVELETDKVTLEVNASSAGIITEINVQQGGNVAVGALLGTIGEADAAALKASAANANKTAAPVAAPVAAPAPAPQAASQNSGQPLSPAVRKMTDDNNINAAAIGSGTGKDGRLTKEDVQNYMAQPNKPAAAPKAPSGPRNRADQEERVRMTRLRQRIAQRLKEAQNTAAMLTTFNEVDMSNLMAMRKQYNETFEKKHGVKLGFMSLFVKACIQALKALPAVNAEIDGEDLVYKNYYDIGVAVGTENGLVVPVVRDADQLGFAEIEKTISKLAVKARDGKLSMDELTGGTFTITNGGIYGSLMSTPILNPPQSGILGMHKIQDRPVVVNGQMVVRPMMYLALSYDHRVIDGREAVTFLVKVKECLEDPQRMLLDL
ncbi:MAG: 2-oxoglutarate dehydrogenase complex dihydrolipoyllysine-residue succinyltransferase [Alphaproteobacteria bacterium]|nr:2-oxoglutarate dehydrogenase complex dihydrolipoyllysine-residue succinyltransferase [Alphaproteobacteria bacterium]